jgi:hypothetical protein
MPSGDCEGKVREGDIAFKQRGKDMPFDMVDPEYGYITRKRHSLGVGYSHEQGADKPRSPSYHYPIYLVQVYLGFGKRLFDHYRAGAQVVTCGKLRDYPAVFSVDIDLGCNDIA